MTRLQELLDDKIQWVSNQDILDLVEALQYYEDARNRDPETLAYKRMEKKLDGNFYECMDAGLTAQEVLDKLTKKLEEIR